MTGNMDAKVSLLMEGYPRNGFAVFSNFLGKDQGVCITRLHPEYVVEKYGLKNSRFHWLSGVKQQGTLSPKNVSALVKQVRGEIKDGQRKFFLDGLEYLLLWNDMNGIVASLKEIEKDLEKAEGSMIVSIDPLTFEEKDLRKLKDSFPRMPELSAGSQQTDADVPAGKGRIDADLLVSRGLTATP
ncbi:MAG TPA: DUF835 domain-containing protein [Methanomassiliicoccales archaeon]|nr:DUF835 domain-containing protein [Methanomassiliicoccales archaeon]HQQ25347.1 DUF835 domain-containing protein [Methanomassiliicoccales archaeon]